MDELVRDRQFLMVRQKKEWAEILLPYEAANRFELTDENDQFLGRAAEESGGIGKMFLRGIFGRCRAAKVHLYDGDGNEIALVDKPFRWYFHRCELRENGVVIGAIQRKFSILTRIFVIEDPQGTELLQIESPFLRWWTFKLLLNGIEVGRIAKKWGGLLKEVFTDADVFGVEFREPSLDVQIRKLLVAAVFLVDFTCFENNQGRGSLIDGLNIFGD